MHRRKFNSFCKNYLLNLKYNLIHRPLLSKNSFNKEYMLRDYL